MKISRKLSLLAVIAILFTAFSCNSSSGNQDVVGNVPLCGVNGEEYTGINVEASATSAAFYIYTPIQPAVTSNAGWVTGYATAPGEKGIAVVSLNIQPNETGQPRSAELRIIAGNKYIAVTVNQSNTDFSKPEPDSPVPGDSTE